MFLLGTENKWGHKYTTAGVRTMQKINIFKASGLLCSPLAIKGLYGSALLAARLLVMISMSQSVFVSVSRSDRLYLESVLQEAAQYVHTFPFNYTTVAHQQKGSYLRISVGINLHTTLSVF